MAKVRRRATSSWRLVMARSVESGLYVAPEPGLSSPASRRCDLAGARDSAYLAAVIHCKSDTMRRTAILALLLSALAAPAAAGEIASLTSSTGVAVQAAVEGGERLVITIVPDGGIRLNGRLGVSFEGEDAPWQGLLPHIVYGEGDYFLEPVRESLALDAAALGPGSTLSVTFGSCLPDSGICVLEETAVTLIPAADGSIDLSMASIQP